MMSETLAPRGLKDNSNGEEPWDGNSFVSAYPPFCTWKKDQAPKVVDALRVAQAEPSRTSLGIYVHIPFCSLRCDYCYYLSFGGTSAEQQADYVETVLAEAGLYAGAELFRRRTPDFVYFGGGTPSVLPEPLIERLISGLRDSFSWRQPREVTFECAPQSVTPEKLRLLRNLGVTRISLGVQSFDDRVLRGSRRVHLRDDVERAYAMVREVGFHTINVDLMVGLPEETDATVAHSVDRAIELGCDNVTVYQLEVPFPTPLHRRLREEALCEPLPPWEAKRARLRSAFDRLEGASYIMRSAYTAARDAAHRPFAYQDRQYRGADLLGLGASAFSYLAGVHFQNYAALQAYQESVEAGSLPVDRAYELDADEKLVREFVLQLKLLEVDAAYFRARFGVDVLERFREPLGRFAEQGWLAIQPGGVRVTRDGLLRVDRLLPAFYRPEHRDLRSCA